ncbi:MAG TPA: non-ribosomal peptide synthase/polyketide synthase [Longimicrobium sp.]
MSVPGVARHRVAVSSFAQERLWLVQQLDGGSEAYHLCRALRVRGPLSARALERALGEVVRRHETLRTTFRQADGQPVQVIAPYADFALPVEDASELDAAGREAYASRRAAEELARPFDLAAGPLFRARLLRLADDDHVLLLGMHHIVSDGWSMGILTRELSQAYAAFADGRDPALPDLPVQYASFARFGRKTLQGPVLERQLAYWKAQLAGAPALLELPTDFARPAVQSAGGAAVHAPVAAELMERVQAAGKRQGATPFMVLLAAFQVLLARYAGSDDVVVGSPIAGRTRREVEGLIGFFVNTLVLRTDLSGDPTFREVLGRVQGVTLDAYDHQEVPFEKLVAELQPERSLSHSPLFQVMFSIDGAPSAFQLPGTETSVMEVEHVFTRSDISLLLSRGETGWMATAHYRTELFERRTMERMLGHLVRVLEQVADDADVRISALELMDASEQARLRGWNDTEDGASAECVHRAFEARAARSPDAVAVTFEEGSLTYGELDGASNRMARRLAGLGVGAESRVGLCLERGVEMVVGMLGVLKAGGAYVPLDPAAPAERLRGMVAGCGVSVLLTQARLRASLPETAGVRVVCVDAEWPRIAAESAAPVDGGATARSLAYVIHTSGSTGAPKGVAVEHGALANHMAWFIRGFGVNAGDRVLQKTPIGFDASVWEFYAPLLAGGELVLARHEGERDPGYLARTVRDRGITLLQLVPSVLRVLLDEPELAECASLRTLFCGGEALPGELCARVSAVLPAVGMVNLYGPAECCIDSSVHHCAPDDHALAVVPIGRPVANTRSHVLDASLRPVPSGIPGELCIGGAQVARGYLGRAGLTAERFVPDPFAVEPGTRLYRTGDRARWRGDGTLEYLGRLDEQVKIRGVRIEPGEIEAVLRRHPGVAACAVVARDDVHGGRRLVAYVVGPADADALRAHLRRTLPETLVPSAFVALDALPLSRNGKLDRRALPAPEVAPGGEAYRSPRTPAEEVLAGIWAQVLGVDRVGIDQNFFELGGHSLLAMRVLSRIREVLGAELPLRALFAGPTVAELAERVEEARRAGLPVLPPVVPVRRTEAPPLSFAQERLWFLDRMDGASALYNVPSALRLSGALDAAAMERALGEIVRRHEALRTTFAEVGGVPAQVVHPFTGFALPVEALSGVDEGGREAAAARRVADDAARPFDLAAGPLFRASLLRLADDEHLLLVCIHHVVSDGWSTGVLFRELAALYEAYANGAESPLAPLPVQYADFAVWQREQLAGAALDRQLGWWKERLAGAPALLELPTDFARPAVRTHAGAHEPVALSRELMERLQALGRGQGATLYMVLLAAFQVLLSKYAGSDDVVVGSPIAGRTRRETEELVGFFVNTLALRTDLSGDPAFREVLRRVRDTTLGAYEHQEVPFEKLVAELAPERSTSYSPLFQAVFLMQEGAGAPAALGGLAVRDAGAVRQTSKFDLSLSLAADERGLHGAMAYTTDLFEAATIRRMLGHLHRVLEQVAADADAPLSALELLTPDERALVVGEWNRNDAPVPAGECIHTLFQAQVLRTPDAVAAVHEHDSLTYGELNARANRLAHHLARLGVGPEVRVGICLERGVELLVSMLAVLKAGGAYVPLDPAYPVERLGMIVSDAGSAVLVTQEKLRGLVPGQDGVRTVVIDADAAAIAAESSADPASEARPENLAYLIYTSGSTGRPKGVAIQHASAVAMLAWGWGVYSDDDLSGMLASTSICFDISVFELFLPLARGGRVIIVENALALPSSARAGEVRLLNTVPSAGAALLRSGGIPAGVRTINLAGEPLKQELVDALYALGHVDRVIDLYGPSEDTTYSTFSVRTAGGRANIGRCIANSQGYVLDRGLRPVPVGVVGELYLAGAGISRGYLGRPGLTADRYVPDPIGGIPGARLYRSGDKIRWRADGVLEYLGRLDEQVKVRGFRIELGEIEATLRRCGVADCVVVARADDAGDRRVVAYVVGGPDADALRAAVGRTLPEYMVPAAFVGMDALPLTPNGKIDKKALPAPEFASSAAEYVAPGTPTEAAVAAAWAEVLRVDRVGVRDGFFALGGHSLLATRVVSRLREALGVELPLRALFEAPTVAELARRVDALRGSETVQLPPVAPVDRAGPLPLSFAQERLWFLDRMEPGSTTYNVPAAVRLDGPLNAAALERALGEIVRRHEALRTTFAEAEGGAVQVIHPFAGFTLPVEDLSALHGDAREAQVGRRSAEDAARPFDLAAGPLLRASLLRLGDEEHVLLLCMHHVASDGWSLGIFFRELAALYETYRNGAESLLPPLPVQYADFAAWQRAQLEGAVLDRQLAYWKERLAGAPALLELPADRPRPAVQTYRGARVPVALAPALVERVDALARAEGATPYMVLLGAFQVLLSKYSGSDDVVVGSPVAGRTRGEVEGLIGLFINTLVLRTELDGDPGFREVLRRVRETTLGAWAHQEVPFERLVAELQPERSLSHAPLFQAMFTLQNNDRTGRELAGVRTRIVNPESESTKFDLSLTLMQDGAGMRGAFAYSTDLFERATVERMLAHLQRVLEQVTAQPEARLSELELLDDAERALVLTGWNATEADYSADACFHQLFEAQAEQTPDAVAVVCEDHSLTYRELNAHANQLAHHLARLGVGPDVRVAMCFERGAEMIVALLGILKAGGAYVALDTALPAERLRYMLRNSRAAALVTRSDLADALPVDAIPVIRVDTDLVGERADDPRIAVRPEHLAYAVYTSGSTGQPKGVGVEHRQIVNYVHGVRDRLELTEGASYATVSTLSADLGNTVVFSALAWGGTLHVISEERLFSGDALGEYFARHAIDCLKITPSHLAALQTGGDPRRVMPRRWLVLGGEASSIQWVDELVRMAPGCAVFNHYGPTETTVGALTFRVTAERPETPSQTLVLGRPLPNYQVFVVDAALRPVPVGVAGELLIGGAGVARGYLDRPELTGERFVASPFGEGRLYRTGDRCRRLADGTIEFLGRMDQQVKIRGFRVELGEIEAVLRQAPSVAECVVVAREDVPGEKRLVAYVVGSVDADGLRAHLRRTLPDYMVPGAFVPLDGLPLTPNGKLDRRALPAPEADGEARYVAPRTPAEEMLAAVWAAVLGTERVGVEESFFALGGHSLLATRVVARVREVFGVELPLRVLFEGPTVARLAERVEALRRAGLPVLPPVVPVERTDAPPLSFAQERLWFLHQMEGASAAYNVPSALRLRGALDVAALERALGEVVRRHEALRTTFRQEGEAAVQVIAPFAGFALPVEDLASVDADAREGVMRGRAAEEAARPFDLSTGPLFRAALLRMADEEHVLLICMHHIVSDAWSRGVLSRELAALYRTYRNGGESLLAPLAVQYADYAVWQREQLQGAVLDRQLAYWKQALAGAPALLELPTDHPRPAVQTYRGAAEPVAFSGGLLARLEALARAEGATLYMVLLAAFQLLLGRYAGTDDVVVGSPIAGRTRRETEELIGFFINTLVLRTELGGAGSFRELLRRVRQTTLGAYEHQEVPFERLVAELQPERSRSHAPLFQVMFTLQNTGRSASDLDGVRVEHLGGALQTTKFDLSLALAADEGGLRGVLEYATGLFDRATIVRMAGHLGRVLEQVADDADRPIADIALVDGAERAVVVGEWNRTDAAYPADACIHQLFEAQAARTPQAVAVSFDAERLTYAELNARANRLAHHLRRRGVGAEVHAAICMERGVEMVVSMLAVLKAGGAYVPLDPAHPAERLERMLSDSGAAVLLTQDRLRDTVPAAEGVAVVRVDAEWLAIAAESAANPQAGTSPRGLAYVIYTSGSTGTPKGVGIEHRALVNHMAWFVRDFGLTAGDRVLQKTPVVFDASVWEFYAPLLVGGELVMARHDGERDPRYLARTLRDRGITVLQLVPALLRVLLDEPELAACASLRQLFCGGEALPGDLVRRTMDVLPQLRITNLYGPAECCIDTSTHRCAHADGGRAVVSIGRPVSNTRSYVVDAALRPVPVGVPGELCIGGVQVARGYLGRAAMTAERFVPDPFGAGGARLYRSGDKVRWRADGVLEYLGRLDEQVKVRGFRIELGEIEATLRRAGVAECAVVVRADEAGEKRIVAYVVTAVDADALRTELRRTLPEYMVPAAFVAMETLPLTPNGKLDRKALPAPEFGSAEDAYVAPRTPVEEAVAAIWGDVLRLERVGVRDDFFALGGHSLLATRVVARIRDVLDGEISVVALFENPTIDRLAPLLSERAADSVVPAAEAELDLDASPHLLMASLDDLSEEELDRLLAAQS